MEVKELRRDFLSYFASLGHEIVPSASLIPAEDPSLLFVNAGMVPFKDCFLGRKKLDYRKAASCQKSLRISGKHNDLDNVGRTKRHHTFFEMLGNFSFGDYFKEESIEFAWEFLVTNLGLSTNRLWVTTFCEDGESQRLWTELTDISPERVLPCSEKDNFWAMGDVGPCGPCSEIHYYLGEDLYAQTEELFRKDEGIFLEIWNLVFMQYNKTAIGELEPLPKPSVDTGMGLERIASVVQGVESNYETDELAKIIQRVERLSGVNYMGNFSDKNCTTEKLAQDTAIRVTADHARASAMLIAEGIRPSSEGRGYVLRRLIRRASRHGLYLGLESAGFCEVVDKVVDCMGKTYPELVKKRDVICSTVVEEQKQFSKTLSQGMSFLDKELKKLEKEGLKILDGKTAFVLHDTYGFPLDLTIDISAEHGIEVERDGFCSTMQEQKDLSRSARSQLLQIQTLVTPIATAFVGYDFLDWESEILAMYNSNGKTHSAKKGEEIAVIVEETPFYAESGGQIGDTGSINASGVLLYVMDTIKGPGGTIVHLAKVSEGEVESGLKVLLEVDALRRRELSRHHSATHLLHQVLREFFGSGIEQGGSRVGEENLRFDYAFGRPLKEAEVENIEERIAECIAENYSVETNCMSLDEAKAMGAIALFGQKYGDLVRVVRIGPGSIELCGGTHVTRSGDIGQVSVLSESGISAGVRRIEIACGVSAVREQQGQRRLLSSIVARLKVPSEEVLSRLNKLESELAASKREAVLAGRSKLHEKGAQMASRARPNARGISVVSADTKDLSPGELRELADDIRGRLPRSCVGLGSIYEGKAVLLVAISSTLESEFHAGDIIREIASIMGAKGGGKASLAQAGGGDPQKLRKALERFEEIIE